MENKKLVFLPCNKCKKDFMEVQQNAYNLTIKSILVALAFILLLNVVSADIEDLLGKDKTCEILNVSGSECDAIWCVEVIGGNFTSDACIVINETIINNTIIINNTNSTNSTELNESELFEKFFSNISSDLHDEILKNLSVNFVRRGELEETSTQNSSGSSAIVWVVSLFLLIVVAVLAIYLIMKKGGDQPTKDYPAYTEHPKIRNRQELDVDEENRELKRKLKKLEKKKGKKASQDSEDEDDDEEEEY